MKRFSPACERNRDPILRVLETVLPPEGTVLEVGCGTGQHAVHFARHLPRLLWQPTDPDPDARASAAAWAEEARLPNLRPPLDLDLLQEPWPSLKADALFSANVLHISPRETTEALFRLGERVLPPGAPLVVYGPFVIPGVATAPTNLAFDDWLRAQDSRWGLRPLADVDRTAESAGFRRERVEPMPANNFTLIFRLISAN